MERGNGKEKNNGGILSEFHTYTVGVKAGYWLFLNVDFISTGTNFKIHH